MTYFISIEELKQNNVINANVDSEYIEPALKEAQTIFLKELIGDALYTAIENKINGNTLTGKYQTLVNDYIKPYLEMRMLSSLVVPISMKIRNAGVVQQFDQGFNSSNVKDVAYLADYYNNRVEFYENRMTEYLKKNAADIPEYGYSSENITNPTQTHTAGTIYLGGGRKRSCGLKTGSGGGSTDKVEWNDIQNKPDFAEVATSGSYNDLEDTPDIPAVSDATINIYQGNTLKGSFSLNQENGQNINLEAGGSGSTDWSDIQNKPDFAPVATSGDYNDLSNRPDMDEYVDMETYNQGMNNVDSALENRVTYGVYTPKIETIDNALNDKVDTTALCTINNERLDTRSNFELVRTDSIATLTIKQGGTTKGTFTPNSGTDVEINLESGGGTQVQSDWNQSDNTAVDYIKNKPAIPTVPTNVSAFANDAGYLTQHQSLQGLATENYVDNAIQQVEQEIPTVPTNVSAFTNDAGYLTQHQSLAGYATENWVQQQGYSTFSGSYNDLTNKPNFATVATSGSYTDLTNKPALATVATSGSYNDLSDQPTIPAAQVQSDWNANSGMGQILNKPSMTTETWTFTVDNGQGGTTTVTKTVWLQ